LTKAPKTWLIKVNDEPYFRLDKVVPVVWAIVFQARFCQPLGPKKPAYVHLDEGIRLATQYAEGVPAWRGIADELRRIKSEIEAAQAA